VLCDVCWTWHYCQECFNMMCIHSCEASPLIKVTVQQCSRAVIQPCLIGFCIGL
jgi:hypothetical protein